MVGVNPTDQDDVRAGVDAALAAHVDRLREEVAPLGPDAAPLVEALEVSLAGGKRLRAAFAYWSWRAHLAGPPDEAGHRTALRVGAALELYQAAALVHDDLMDGSDTRRGRPATHRAFEATHRERGWAGDAGRFGESAAILLGDLALVAAEREFTDAVTGADHGPAAHAVFDTMRTEVSVGQYLDVLGQVTEWGSDPAGDEVRARHVVRAKSARYSVEHPLAIGAALAGADPAARARISRIGLAVGEAFQLRDDLLGVFGDPATTGKPAGDDLREGKRTVLLARTAARATAAEVRLLRAHLGRRDLDADAIAELRGVVERSGAVADVETLIAGLAEPALAELAAAPLAEPARSVLLGLGRAAVQRET